MKILANDGISKKGEAQLKEAGFEVFNQKISQENLIDFINNNCIDVLLVRSATQIREDIISHCPTLKILGRGGIGMDNIDVEFAKNMGLKVINTPEASSRSVAELVFAHIFSMCRNLHDANRMMPLEGETQFDVLKKSYANAVELEGKSIGIIGFGSIGKAVAKMAISLGMKVKAFTRNPVTETLQLRFFDGKTVEFSITTTNDWQEFVKDTHFFTIHTPKTEGYLIDAEKIAQMEDGSYIVNTSRGGVLDEVAVLNALEEEKLAGAALDVFENEPKPAMDVLMHPKMSLSPHIGGNTIDAQEKIGLELAEQIIEIQKNLKK